MAFLTCQFYSDALGQGASIHAIIPEQEASGSVGVSSTTVSTERPTLWLLHGLSDDHTHWMRRSSIERYATERGLAVIMPAVGRSFYQNIPGRLRYFDYIGEELPRICRDLFALSPRREDNFIAGLSMGGYGAFLHAFKHPERYAAAASLSGVLELKERYQKQGEGPFDQAEIEAIFGPEESRILENLDPPALIRQLSKLPESERPALMAACGTEDFLIEANRNFIKSAREAEVKVEYHEEPGAHEWGFWDRWIERVVAWLPIRANR